MSIDAMYRRPLGNDSGRRWRARGQGGQIIPVCIDKTSVGLLQNKRLPLRRIDFPSPDLGTTPQCPHAEVGLETIQTQRQQAD
ncbi:hypothetical protein ACOMHN_027355 [Nucella lapillus]